MGGRSSLSNVRIDACTAAFTLLVVSLASVAPTEARAQDDTLAVELAAVRELVGGNPGRPIVIEPRFAAAGQAPPSITTIHRPATRQHALEDSLAPTAPSTNDDTLFV